MRKFLKEIFAYLRQAYNFDFNIAKETYGGMFKDWNKVAEAIEKFNQAVGPNKKATSDNEAASFMPKNSAQESFEDIDGTDVPEQSETRQGETQNVLSDRISILKTNTERRHTTLKEQEYIKSLCDALGREVVFENVLEVLRSQGIEVDQNNIPDGYIDENNVIHIGYTVYNPVQFILKHELTHFGEGTEAYTAFIEAVQTSKAYLNWLQKKTGSASNSLGKLEGLYREAVIKSRKKTAPVGAAKAQAEMFADFCGDVMFTERGLKSLANAVEAKHRPKVIQYILDFFAYLKQKLSGNKQFTMEIARLESKYAEMLRSANEIATKNNGEVRYSISNDAIYESYCNKIDDIANSDDESKKGQYIQVSQQTPTIIVEKANAKNLPMAIQFDIAYLETRHDGKLIGNYHDLGAERMKNLPELLENPEFIIMLPNGRLNVIVNMVTNKGKSSLISIELEQSKQVNGKFDKYNLIITAFGAKQGYLDKIINNSNNQILYKKTTESQGTDQLHKGLDGINDSVSNSRVTQKDSTVKKNYMQDNKKYSIPTDTSALLERYENGEIEREEYVEKLEELWGKAIERYGSIEQGENAKAPISVP